MRRQKWFEITRWLRGLCVHLSNLKVELRTKYGVQASACLGVRRQKWFEIIRWLGRLCVHLSNLKVELRTKYGVQASACLGVRRQKWFEIIRWLRGLCVHLSNLKVELRTKYGVQASACLGVRRRTCSAAWGVETITDWPMVAASFDEVAGGTVHLVLPLPDRQGLQLRHWYAIKDGVATPERLISTRAKVLSRREKKEQVVGGPPRCARAKHVTAPLA